jgi:hypothetical protein
MKWIKNGIKNENGEVMLESLIVYSVTIFLLFFILAIFSVLFQRWNIQTIANEAATRVAQTYKLMDADIVTGYVSKAEVIEVREYRYIWKNSELQNCAKTKIEDYASERLKKTTFTKNVTEPQFDINVTKDSLARRHIEVKISGEYSVPFGQALSYFGFGSTTKYEVTAYADCVDIIDYVNTVDYVENQTSLNQFGSKTIGLINAILKLFDNILGE